MTPSQDTSREGRPAELGDLVMAEPELSDPLEFLTILRENPDGLSGPDDFAGASSLLSQKQDLFQQAHLDEIAAYCERLIPELIRTKGSPLQIRALSSLAAEVITIQRERESL